MQTSDGENVFCVLSVRGLRSCLDGTEIVCIETDDVGWHDWWHDDSMSSVNNTKVDISRDRSVHSALS